ncbi:MAG: hypothetical protein JW882_09810 [Deltaproteobacteria bacterium]|nr:hypothetical protein [Deltaproteobacteria bacterium]
MGLIGLREKVRTGERLGVEVRPAAKVFCASCGRHIYYLKDSPENISPECFAPLEGRKKPDSLICPECGRCFTAFENNQPRIKTDRGWM